jgi:hypothetical protein
VEVCQKVVNDRGTGATELTFWAKNPTDGGPGISVRDHCMNVGCVAEALISGCPRTSKICPAFQAKCKAWIQSEWARSITIAFSSHARGDSPEEAS